VKAAGRTTLWCELGDDGWSHLGVRLELSTNDQLEAIAKAGSTAAPAISAEATA